MEKKVTKLNGDSQDPVLKYLVDQWFAMNRRAKSREDCVVMFKDYQHFKSWALSSGWERGLCFCRNGDTGNYTPKNMRLDTKANNNIEDKASKFSLVSPEGVRYHGVNIASFARDKNLSVRSLQRVVSGGRMSHKGWKAYVET